MKTKTLVTGVLVAGVGLAIGWIGSRERGQRERSADALRLAIGEHAARMEAMAAEAKALRDAMGADVDATAAANRRRAMLERERAGALPEALRWNRPPEDWPVWESASPYVWIDKETLKSMPIGEVILGTTGQLSAVAREILALDEATVANANRELAGVFLGLKQAELAQARRLPEERGPAEDGVRRVVVHFDPDPEVASRVRGEFESALTSTLGAGRAAWVVDATHGWMDERLSRLVGEPTTIEVVARPDEVQDVSIRVGTNTTMSGSGRGVIQSFVPEHLRGLFTETRP